MGKDYKKKKNDTHRVAKIVIIQLLILIGFYLMLYGTKPTPVESTEFASITVDDIRYSNIGGPFLVVSSGSEKYIFSNSGYPDQYSVDQLSEIISVGDCLSIRYEQRFSIRFGIHNHIIDAYSDTHRLRSIEITNEARKEGFIPWCTLWGLIELGFLGLIKIKVL